MPFIVYGTVNQVDDVQDLAVGDCAEQPGFRAAFQLLGKLLQEAGRRASQLLDALELVSASPPRRPRSLPIQRDNNPSDSYARRVDPARICTSASAVHSN
jgi:hypothetical protein